MNASASASSSRVVFTYGGISYASEAEVNLVAHLLVYYALSIDAKDNLLAAARMLLDDSEDYKATSPIEKGPWTTPTSWTGRKGTPMDKFKDLLEDATTLKAGNLTPVEQVMSAHLGISLTAQGIVDYKKRLLAPKDSTKPKALLIPSLDSRHKLRRFPHMLPAVARTILRDFDKVARLYVVTVDKKCSLVDVT